MRLRDARGRAVIPSGDITIGLHRSNLDAMRAILHTLTPPAEACLVDGFRLGPSAPEHTAIVDGDTKARRSPRHRSSRSDADRLMHRMDRLYPQYGFWSHVGYITPGHSKTCASAVRPDPPALLARTL